MRFGLSYDLISWMFLPWVQCKRTPGGVPIGMRVAGEGDRLTSIHVIIIAVTQSAELVTSPCVPPASSHSKWSL